MEAVSLLEKVENECLNKALNLLESETIPTAATVGIAKTLIETAVSIGLLNLQWAEQIRFYASASTGRAFSQPKAKN